MWRKDFGYASRLSIVNLFVSGVVLFHTALIVWFGFAYGAIPQDPNNRLTSWYYYRVFGQNISFAACLLTLWLKVRNFSGWRYWVHMIGCGLVAAWNGLFVAWGIIMYLRPCGSEDLCSGEEPVGFVLKLATRPDWAFLSLLIAVGLSGVISCFYILYGMWLRKRVEMQLMLSAAASRLPDSLNVGLVDGGGSYGAGAGFGYDALTGVLSNINDNNGAATAPIATEVFHSPEDSALYCHDCYVSHERDGSDRIFVKPEESPHVAAFIRENHLQNVHFFVGTVNLPRYNAYKQLIGTNVHEQHQQAFHNAVDQSVSRWAEQQQLQPSL